jgi:hypothetical protein
MQLLDDLKETRGCWESKEEAPQRTRFGRGYGPVVRRTTERTAQHGRLSTAMLCRGLEKNSMVGARHGRGMASVNQTRPYCVKQMGKTHSKPLAARHGRGTACYV